MAPAATIATIAVSTNKAIQSQAGRCGGEDDDEGPGGVNDAGGATPPK
jgi:hypothetical protein